MLRLRVDVLEGLGLNHYRSVSVISSQMRTLKTTVWSAIKTMEREKKTIPNEWWRHGRASWIRRGATFAVRCKLRLLSRSKKSRRRCHDETVHNIVFKARTVHVFFFLLFFVSREKVFSNFLLIHPHDKNLPLYGYSSVSFHTYHAALLWIIRIAWKSYSVGNSQ